MANYFVMSFFCCIFAPMKENNWTENVIIVDADYVDRVAFDLIVNFERMIGRPIPQADLARWIDCLSLDGGMRPNTSQHQETQVVLIHDKESTSMKNFAPGDYENELNGKAFRDDLGEFSVSAFPVETTMVSKDDYFIDVLQTVCGQQEVKRVLVVPDGEHIYNKVREALRQTAGDKLITVFAMQPMPGGRFMQEILGYSLMAALGIRSEELHPNQ
jgi:hypothetical protein